MSFNLSYRRNSIRVGAKFVTDPNAEYHAVVDPKEFHPECPAHSGRVEDIDGTRIRIHPTHPHSEVELSTFRGQND